MKFFTLLTAVFLLFLNIIIARAQTQELSTKEVLSQLELPWEILWGPDDHIWFTERRGTVKRLDPATGETNIILTIENVAFGHESGLLGMTLHPTFDSLPYVYLAHTYTSDVGILEKIVRYTYTDSILQEPLTLLDSIKGNITHIGCRLVIAPDSTLYFSTGDAGNDKLALSLNSLSGKILRINLDGTIPEDNPFPGSPIWSFGHRNPQGLILSPKGILYSSEHGDMNDDELNIITKGGNYGWPKVEGLCDLEWEKAYCLDTQIVEPIAFWQPTLAVCGIDFYDNPANPQWHNSIFLTTLKASTLILLKLDTTGHKIIEYKHITSDFGRLRDVCFSPEGDVYICTSNGEDDKIIKLKANITSVTEQKNTMSNFSCHIYPNPTSGQATLEFSLLKAGNLEVEIRNTSGQKISTVFKGFCDLGDNIIPINMDGFPAGSYTCHIISGSQKSSLTFVHTP